MSLRETIREAVAKAGDEPDVDEITKHVLNTADDEDLQAALFPMVKQVVLNELHLQSASSFVDVVEEDRPAITLSPGPSRVARCVAATDRFLDVVVCLDEVSGTRKRLGVCSLDDIHRLVANRERTAQHFEAEANRFKHLAEVMVAEGAATPADISAASLERLVIGWRS